MKIISNEQIHLVQGAGNLYVTQMIPTDGVSDTCLAGLVQAYLPSNIASLTEEQIAIQILSVCNFNEIEIISDQMDVIAPSQVSFY